MRTPPCACSRPSHPIAKELRAALEDIVSDNARAIEIVRSVRGVFELEQGKMSRIDVTQVLRDVDRIVRADASMRGVSLSLQLFKRPAFVTGDRAQLIQALLNLVFNAFDAVCEGEGGPREVTVRAFERDPGQAHIAVTDSGKGIAPEVAAQMFNSFFTTKSNGMGMGLAIARSIVENQHGRLQAFQKSRPRRNPGNDAAVRHKDSNARQSGMSYTVKVALIDDNASSRAALVRLIKTARIEVVVFSSAREFLEHPDREQIDCVVTDVLMPGLDGFQLHESLAVRTPFVSTVFVSSHSDIADSVRAIKAGAVDFLEKPVDDEALLDAIRRGAERTRVQKVSHLNSKASRAGINRSLRASAKCFTWSPRDC